MEKHSKEYSILDHIVEIIEASGKKIDLDICDVAYELIDLYETKNMNGMRRLHDVFTKWKSRTSQQKKNNNRFIQEDLDGICQVADWLLKGKNEWFARGAAILNAPYVGPAREFYRQAIECTVIKPYLN